MTSGNLELVQILASWAVTLPATAAIIVTDERRLRGEELERAWPPQSRDAAVFGLWLFGIHHVSVLVHFVKTRWSLAGVALGLRCLLALNLLDDCAQIGAAVTVDWLGL